MNKKIKNIIGVLVVAGFMLMFFASLAYFGNATYVEQTADLTSYPIEPVLADIMGIVALVGILGAPFSLTMFFLDERKC